MSRDNFNLEYMNKEIEVNYSNFHIEMAKLKNCNYSIESDYSWVLSNNNYWPSGIFDLNFSLSKIDNIVKDMADKMELGLLPSTVMTGPYTKPSNIDEYLNRYNIMKKYEAIGMAVELTNLKSDFEDVSNVEISMIEDEALLFKWSKVVCKELFCVSGDAIKEFCDLIYLTLKDDKFKCYGAKYNGELVATSFLFLDKNSAGIYFVATSNEYRNKGIGRLITLEPLKKAKDMGYEIAILQASTLGKVIYEKLGFKECCRLGRYRLN